LHILFQKFLYFGASWFAFFNYAFPKFMTFTATGSINLIVVFDLPSNREEVDQKLE
jgi:hypothetical protein